MLSLDLLPNAHGVGKFVWGPCGTDRIQIVGPGDGAGADAASALQGRCGRRFLSGTIHGSFTQAHGAAL